MKRFGVFVFAFAFFLFPHTTWASGPGFSVTPKTVRFATNWLPGFTVADGTIFTLNGYRSDVVGFQTNDNLPGYMGLVENTGGLFNNQNNNVAFRFWFNGSSGNPARGLYKGRFDILLKDANWRTVQTIHVPATIMLH